MPGRGSVRVLVSPKKSHPIVCNHQGSGVINYGGCRDIAVVLVAVVSLSVRVGVTREVRSAGTGLMGSK